MINRNKNNGHDDINKFIANIEHVDSAKNLHYIYYGVDIVVKISNDEWTSLKGYTTYGADDDNVEDIENIMWRVEKAIDNIL